MPRFIVPQLGQLHVPGTLTLPTDQARHAVKVLRMTVGQSIDLIDGRGHHAVGTIASIARQQVTVSLSDRRFLPRPAPHIQIASAVPKGSRVDTLIEKLAELGVSQWTPLNCEHSVVQPRDNKLDRLRLLALETCKQCHSLYSMDIAPLTDFQSLLTHCQADLLLIAELPEKNEPAAMHVLQTALNDTHNATSPSGSPVTVMVLIGPEGGWCDHERQLAYRQRAQRWSLGATTLRVETAAIAAAAVINQWVQPFSDLFGEL